MFHLPNCYLWVGKLFSNVTSLEYILAKKGKALVSRWSRIKNSYCKILTSTMQAELYLIYLFIQVPKSFAASRYHFQAHLACRTHTTIRVFWSCENVFPPVTLVLCSPSAQMAPASTAGQQPTTQTPQMMGMIGHHQGGPAPANATSYVMQQAAGYPTQ